MSTNLVLFFKLAFWGSKPSRQSLLIADVVPIVVVAVRAIAVADSVVVVVVLEVVDGVVAAAVLVAVSVVLWSSQA